MITQRLDLRFQCRIIRDHCACFAQGAKVLPWIEAETTRHPHGAGDSALVHGAMRLTSILDHRNSMTRSNFQNRVHVRCLAKQMDRNNSSRLARYGGLEMRRVQGMSPFVDVD